MEIRINGIGQNSLLQTKKRRWLKGYCVFTELFGTARISAA